MTNGFFYEYKGIVGHWTEIILIFNPIQEQN